MESTNHLIAAYMKETNFKNDYKNHQLLAILITPSKNADLSHGYLKYFRYPCLRKQVSMSKHLLLISVRAKFDQEILTRSKIPPPPPVVTRSPNNPSTYRVQTGAILILIMDI